MGVKCFLCGAISHRRPRRGEMQSITECHGQALETQFQPTHMLTPGAAGIRRWQAFGNRLSPTKRPAIRYLQFLPHLEKTQKSSSMEVIETIKFHPFLIKLDILIIVSYSQNNHLLLSNAPYAPFYSPEQVSKVAFTLEMPPSARQ